MMQAFVIVMINRSLPVTLFIKCFVSAIPCQIKLFKCLHAAIHT